MSSTSTRRKFGPWLVGVAFTLLFISLLPGFGMLLNVEAANESPSKSSDGYVHSLTIIVSRNGFNGTSPFTISINEGEVVEIKFVYGDSDLPYDNPHPIRISGYDVEVEVSRDNPEASVKFVADKAGRFAFFCVNPGCRGHEKVTGGILEVQERPSEGLPVTVRLRPCHHYDTPILEDGRVNLGALVEDREGKPIPGVTIQFYTNATSWSRYGLAFIGAVKTAGDGVAWLEFEPHVQEPALFVARYGTVEDSMVVQANGTAEHTHLSHERMQIHRPPPPLLALSGLTTLGLIVGGVWGVYAFSLINLHRIRYGKGHHLFESLYAVAVAVGALYLFLLYMPGAAAAFVGLAAVLLLALTLIRIGKSQRTPTAGEER